MVMNKKGSIQLGYNIKRALILGLIFGMGSVLVYLFVVITTPALSPAVAISAVFQINSIIVIGMGIGVGLQMFLSTFSSGLGCRLDVKRRVSAGNSGGAAMTGFFSFFSLIPLGCCGTALHTFIVAKRGWYWDISRLDSVQSSVGVSWYNSHLWIQWYNHL